MSRLYALNCTASGLVQRCTAEQLAYQLPGHDINVILADIEEKGSYVGQPHHRIVVRPWTKDDFTPMDLVRRRNAAFAA